MARNLESKTTQETKQLVVVEHEPLVIAGEAVGRGSNLAVRVREGEYVGVPVYLLGEDVREGDRIRIEVRVAIARQEMKDGTAAGDGGIVQGSDGAAGEAE